MTFRKHVRVNDNATDNQKARVHLAVLMPMSKFRKKERTRVPKEELDQVITESFTEDRCIAESNVDGIMTPWWRQGTTATRAPEKKIQILIL